MTLDHTKFKGKVFKREPLTGKLTEWVSHAYQYAYTSVSNLEEVCNPAYIVYAECDEDIFQVMEYAKENNIGIAVRSGGHQYNGASSTANNNIQLDLSGKLADPSVQNDIPYRKVSLNKEGNDYLLTLGCGVALDEFSELLIQNGLFFPHGECATVHVGGHSNTGGMSVITPSFGAMIDHVVEFELICSKYPNQRKTIKRPDLWSPDKPNGLSQLENDELFWAVLGGSPGNFGIVTEIKVKCLKDADFPHSRGLKLAWPYSPDRVQKISQLVCQVCDDRDALYQGSIALSVVIVGPEYFYPRRESSKPLGELGNLTLDDEVLKNDPKLAGKSKFNYFTGQGMGMVAVYGAFLNPTGNVNYEAQLNEFEKITVQLLAIPGCMNSTKVHAIKDVFNAVEFVESILSEKAAEKTKKFEDSLELPTMMYGNEYVPISQIMNNLSWNNPREFSLSYKKLSFLGNSRKMSEANPRLANLPTMQKERAENLLFATWVSNEIESTLAEPHQHPGMYFAVQFGLLGGPGLENPTKFGGKKEYNALSNRTSNFWFDFDVFYNPTIPNCTEKTKKYIDKIASLVVDNTLNLFNDGKQKRVLLGPAFPFNEQPILDKYWEYFYEDRNQFERLCLLKKKFDPDHVFTANLFCVGATEVDRLQNQLDSLLEKENTILHA